MMFTLSADMIKSTFCFNNFKDYFLFFIFFTIAFAGKNFASNNNKEIPFLFSNNYVRTGFAETNLDSAIHIIIKDSSGNPLANTPIVFSTIPATKEIFFFDAIVFTDANGIASTNVAIGKFSGEFYIVAKSIATNQTIISESIFIKKKKWIWTMLFAIAGGLALFLFGMFILSESLKKAAGNRLRAILKSATKNRITALGTGAIATTIIQSSSAISVLTISLVQSQILKFKNSIGILMGAAIGTTITAQIIAFKITDYALLIIAIGFFTKLFSKKHHWQNIGDSLLGFGILFFGMYIMSEAISPIKNDQRIINLLIQLENPFFGVLVGAMATAIIQSSSAFIGILIILSSQGLISLEAGIPLLLGSNIGTTATSLLACINSSRDAKRVALAFVVIKILGVLLILFWIPYFAQVVEWLSPHSSKEIINNRDMAALVPRQLANAHTLFNVVAMLILLPFTERVANFIIKIIPEKTEKEKMKEQFTTWYLDEKMLATPALATNVAKSETLHMADILQKMVRDSIIPFTAKKANCIAGLEQAEKEIDFLKDKISLYLIQISQQQVHNNTISESFQILYIAQEFEQIADIIAEMLIPKAKDWVIKDLKFSEQGTKELIEYHANTLKQLEMAILIFKELNLEKIPKLEKKHNKYNDLMLELKKNHFGRLSNSIPESLSSSNIHLDLISAFRLINSHSVNIGRILTTQSGNHANNKGKNK